MFKNKFENEELVKFPSSQPTYKMYVYMGTRFDRFDMASDVGNLRGSLAADQRISISIESTRIDTWLCKKEGKPEKEKIVQKYKDEDLV